MRGEPATEPVPTLISLFRRSARLMADDLLRRLDAAGYPGITASEHLIFESLPPAGARVTEIAARVGMTHQAAGELVAALETRGFVERRPDPADRRARTVVLTSEGRALIRTALREISAIERSWSARLAETGLTGELRAALHAAVVDPPVANLADDGAPTCQSDAAIRASPRRRSGHPTISRT